MHFVSNGSIIICNLLVPVPLLVLLLSGKDLYGGKRVDHHRHCYHDDVYTILYLECLERTLLVVGCWYCWCFSYICLFVLLFCGNAQSYQFVQTKNLYIILLQSSVLYDESRCRELAVDQLFRMTINGCIIVKREIILLRLKV